MSAPANSQLEAMGLSSTCAEVLRHLWEYLDDELTGAGAERLRAHLETCVQCREYEGFQTCFLETLARLRRELDAPSTVREKVAETLRSEGCRCWEQATKR